MGQLGRRRHGRPEPELVVLVMTTGCRGKASDDAADDTPGDSALDPSRDATFEELSLAHGRDRPHIGQLVAGQRVPLLLRRGRDCGGRSGRASSGGRGCWRRWHGEASRRLGRLTEEGPGRVLRHRKLSR